MPQVNLFVIGINKAGTSWLYYLLRQHPDVFMSEVKELYFFGDHEDGPETLEAYHSHFPFEANYRYFGEATVMYYRDAQTAEQIYSYNPEAKVLAIVRDPIQRLLSQYRYHKQLGLIDETTSLQEALNDPDSMLLRDSHYEDTLPAFAKRFGDDQFTVVSLEEGKNAPDELWETLLSVLDLPPVPCPNPNANPENPTGSAGYRRVYRYTVRPIKNTVPGLYKWMLQSQLVRWAKLGLIRLLGTAEADEFPEALQTRLRTEFAPTYAYLQNLGFESYASPSSEANQ